MIELTKIRAVLAGGVWTMAAARSAEVDENVEITDRGGDEVQTIEGKVLTFDEEGTGLIVHIPLDDLQGVKTEK